MASNEIVYDLHKMGNGYHIQKSTFMTSTRKGVFEGGLEICHGFADSIIFKQKIHSSFMPMGVWVGGGHNIGHFFV